MGNCCTHAVCLLERCFETYFNYKRSESVRIFQVSFGTLDFRHLYDLHRWRFLQTIGCKSTYSADLVKITDLQYHICVDLADAYLPDNRSASFTNAVYSQCRELFFALLCVFFRCQLHLLRKI